MDIILLQDVDKVGDKFDVVTVKNGYGRNYLIPQKLALIANDTIKFTTIDSAEVKLLSKLKSSLRPFDIACAINCDTH